MAMDAIRIVPMPDDGLEAAAAVMDRAFLDEPLFVAGFPTPEERERVVPWIAQWTFQFGLEFGRVLVSEDLAGTAIAYQATEPVFSDDRVSATEVELREQIGLEAWGRYERMMHIWETAEATRLIAKLRFGPDQRYKSVRGWSKESLDDGTRWRLP